MRIIDKGYELNMAEHGLVRVYAIWTYGGKIHVFRIMASGERRSISGGGL